jgi:hypothetical protein
MDDADCGRGEDERGRVPVCAGVSVRAGERGRHVRYTSKCGLLTGAYS